MLNSTPHILAQSGSGGIIALTVLAVVVILVGFVVFLAKRYKRCPSNRVLVIYGRTGSKQSAKPIHGGGAFIWPVIQNYAFLNLDPIQIEIPLSGALSAENIRINVPSVFTVAVGTTSDTMQNACVRLLGLTTSEVSQQARDIIFGQLRQVIASMRIEDINRDRDQFLLSIQSSLEPELNKIGLVLINVNITDITDESGYIEAIGRKAASEAIQQAEIDVAEQRKLGAIGVAEARREEEVQVSVAEKERQIGTTTAMREQAVEVARLEKERIVGEQQAAFQRETQVKMAEQEMRISVAAADAKAVRGENEAKADIADANAQLGVRQAEAYQLSETRKREADAHVEEAQYKAEAQAALAEAAKIEAEKRAELEAPALAQKAKVTVDAEAEAEKRRIEAEGEAKAIFLRLEAEARGQYEMLKSKADGLQAIVDSCGGAQQAFQMLMLEHIDNLAGTAAEAISNVKFDKVVVWDGGNGEGGTASFVRRLGGMLPPMLEVMKDIGGVEMPEFFGKLVSPEANGQPAVDAAKTEGKDGERAGAVASVPPAPGRREEGEAPPPAPKRGPEKPTRS